MSSFSLYEWILPNKNKFLSKFQDNDQLYRMAQSFWEELNSAALWFLLTFIVIAIISACLYYYQFTNMPGRKYKIWWWALFLVGAVGITFGLTFGIGSGAVVGFQDYRREFLLRISLINGAYSALVYFLCSFVICNIPVHTNAYRFLKIGK